MAQQEVDVVIVGAGLAGLNAALTLQDAGRTVTVLEARHRVGGRVRSLDGPSGVEEAGAINIGDGYARVLARVEEAGLALEPMTMNLREHAIIVGGHTSTPETWPQSPGNPLTGRERSVPPAALLPGAMMRSNPLTGPRSWTGSEAIRWDVPAAEHLRRDGLSTEAVVLLDRAGVFETLASASALALLRTAHRLSRSGHVTSNIVGGNSLLPTAMAARLNHPPRLGSPVAAVSQHASGISVTTADGSVITARHVVLAIPFTTLRRIALSPALPDAVARLVTELPYTAVTKYHLCAERPYWLEDGLPATMWTDSRVQRVLPWRLAQSGPSALAVWVTGPQARELDVLPPEMQCRIVLAELAALRPAMAGSLQVTRVVSWAGATWSGGAWAMPAPGQCADLAAAIHADTGRIHLAGEHLALDDSGMEGAMESGERAAERILAGS